jgi:hypothetical protein
MSIAVPQRSAGRLASIVAGPPGQHSLLLQGSSHCTVSPGFKRGRSTSHDRCDVVTFRSSVPLTHNSDWPETQTVEFELLCSRRRIVDRHRASTRAREQTGPLPQAFSNTVSPRMLRGRMQCRARSFEARAPDVLPLSRASRTPKTSTFQDHVALPWLQRPS